MTLRKARLVSSILTRGALVLLLCLSSGSAFGKELFTPWHVAKIRTVTEAVISPDGSHVAYILGVPRAPLVRADPRDQ